MKVTFDNAYSAFQVIAPKGTMISYTATPTAIADGVYVIGDEGSICIDDQLTDTLYLSTVGSDYTVTDGSRVIYPLGDTSVIIRGNISTVPFKSGAKGGGSGGGCNYKGTTTTAIENGSTTNPITIDGESYTAVFGDIVVYGYTEFVFDGSAWSEFGRPFDTTPTSGSANAVTSDGIKTALDTKQNVMQYTTMPTITASMLGQIAQYVGETTNDYVKGYFYIASSDGAAEPTYSWVSMVDDVPTSGSRNLISSDAVYQRTPWIRDSGNYSVRIGYNSSASGTYALAYGYYAKANANYSMAFGRSITANREGLTAMGSFNDPKTGDIFELGKGTSAENRANILEVTKTSLNVNGDIMRDGVGIDDYTTTERKIGKWIDGSDLYQRTFEVTASSVNGWNDDILGTSGIKIVDVQGFMYGLYEGVYVSKPLVYFRNTTDYITFIYDSDVNVYIMDPAVSTSPMPTLTITIKYTKPSVQANLMQTPISTEEEVSETPTTVEEDDMR